MATLIALLGDFHIPTRAYEIPPKIVNLIYSRKPHIILCTGDLIERYVLEELMELADKVVVVEGNMDRIKLPRSQVVRVEDLKIGLIHGHQVFPRGNISKLAQLATRMKVDVLVSGHTHNPFIEEVRKQERKVLLLNPGSATGVWGGGGGSLIPAFMILEVHRNRVKALLYEGYETLRLSKVREFEF